jgi:hypothetical protein
MPGTQGSRVSIARAFVKRLTMLVTSDGKWVLEDSTEFLAALGDPNPDYDGTLFAIKNLGFVRFQILDNSIIEIDLHPRNVKLPALLAVQQQILSSRVKLFRIRYFDTAWQSEITSSTEGAVSRLAELCTPAFAPPLSQKFVVEPQDYSTMLGNEASPLRLIAQKWRMSFGHFDPSVISFAIDHELLSRMMIFGVKPNGSDPVFRFIGDGFQWLEDDYQFYGVGERVENQPDREYGGWVSQFYKSVASTGQPRYDHVTAAIQVAPGERSLFATRYERLLLPWKTSDEVLVSMSSKRLGDEKVADLGVSEPNRPLFSIAAKSS